MKSTPLLLFLALALSGCISPPQMPRRQVATPFKESDFKAFVGLGTSTIEGQAFLLTQGGDVKYAAGKKVSLLPVTAYTTEMWEMAGAGVVPIKDYNVEQFFRSVISDGFGNFSFENIPAGEWYVECAHFWNYIGGVTGRNLRSKVVVKPGEKLKIILH